MLRDKNRELFERLECKDLDHQFQNRIEKGMGCSPFVAEAIKNVVNDVYFPILNSPLSFKPGQLMFQCLSKNCGASVPIAEAEMLQVILTLDSGQEDLEVRKKEGVIGLRQHRIYRLCTETYSQDGLLTVEDLAYRLLNVGERTICRDLKALRERGCYPPLRSTVKDIGRTISHRAIIVRSWLLGDELSDLNRKYHHSFSAIENYLNTFKRVIALDGEKYEIEQIAYVLKISRQLADIYLLLWKDLEPKALAHRRREILDVLISKSGKKSPMKSREL